LRYIREHRLNERFGPDAGEIGIVMQGGMYNSVLRALLHLGLADIYGDTRIPLYVLNVTYPLVDDELVEFCAGKSSVLVIEEGAPDFLEQAIGSILRKNDLQTRLSGKDVLPMGGEYTTPVLMSGIERFLERFAPQVLGNRAPLPSAQGVLSTAPVKALAEVVPARPAGFCTGCPERPIFAALKLVERELGRSHVAADIGCHLFSILPPFEVGATTMGYGLGPASASAFSAPKGKRAISIMGDGGFWHNGLTTSIGNAVFNRQDSVILVVDNYYSAATGGQDILSSRALNPFRKTNNSIVEAVRGIGVDWVRQIDRTYNVTRMRDVLREALTTSEGGPKVIVASSECMLNRQRREKPKLRERVARGERQLVQRFGVDEDVCNGDHACIRLSGCPSLSVKPSSDPLRDDPVASIDQSCVACGNCGEVADAAILCPSFYRADVVANPNILDRALGWMRNGWIGFLQRRAMAKRPFLAKGAL
jgi:indolepyruvate ferredoxin oxidoreductase alpha subunit